MLLFLVSFLNNTRIARKFFCNVRNFFFLAFGKTVNKPNVRFVIHHTLPQSLEQYERQCALAGTDGQLSHCVLLYSFNDHLRVLRLIKEDIPKPPPNVMAMKECSLKNVLRYCENVAECRRKKLAAAFDEVNFFYFYFLE